MLVEWMGVVMGDRGWIALRNNGPLTRLIEAHPAGDGLPCCSFVAAWSLCMVGLVGEDIGTTLPEWARLAPSYWGLANITSFGSDEIDEVLLDHEDDREWDSLEAALRLLGGRLLEPVLVGPGQDAPALEPARWHIVQRWDVSARSGHTYLVRANEDGNECEVIQSSIRLGYRENLGSWEGTAGLSGYTVGLVVLPSLG